jgi:hypothetical protein
MMILLAIAAAFWLFVRVLNSRPKSLGHIIAVGVDVLIAVVIWRKEGITISSHSALAARRGKTWGCVLCRFLGWLNRNHCEGAIKADIQRARDALKELDA